MNNKLLLLFNNIMIKLLNPFLKIFFCFIILILSYNRLFSSTSISIDPDLLTGLDDSDFDMTEMENQIEHTADKNGPFIANAFSLSNLLGYPIGKAALGSFPHFEFGLAGGAGCTNMKYFDENDSAHDNGTLPVFAPNPVIHFGLGLFGGLDILGRFLYISKSTIDYFKEMDYDREDLNINSFKIYSIGTKIRYNYFKKKTFLPFYLSFGGLTFSLGGNFMYGDINLSKDYQYNFSNIDINGVGTTDVDFSGPFEANIHWAIFTLDAQAVAYLDIFYFISLYTGFGIAGNLGYFKLEVEGTGDITSPQPAPLDQLGTLTFSSKNKYYSTPVTPIYIFGIELNILALKLDFQTMVNLYNRSDVNAELGTRIQF